MMVSVVVIGRNEGSRLARCLDSVLAMRQDGFTAELIYVDSQSTDSSLEVAQSFGAACLELTTGQMTAARARNAGWRAAHGEFVLFLDGDTVLAPEFVSRALPHFDNPDVAVVWGNRREMDVRSIYNRVLDLDWASEAGWTQACGGDSLMRRAALDTVGGFDNTLIAGEEPELCQRLGAFEWRIYHMDELMTMHDLSIRSFGQYWKRSVRTGYAYSEVSQRCRWMGRPFWVSELQRARTPYSDIALDLRLADGVATIEDGTMQGPDAVVGVTGTADIGNRGLDLAATATKPDDARPADALSVAIKGSFDAPAVAPGLTAPQQH